MAISIISQPDLLSPAYNDVNWVIDSTNKLEPQFKYIVDIYDVAAVPTLLKRYRINPEPINKYGEFNLSQFLQSQVDFNLTQLYTNGASTASRSQFPYTLKFGEEFVDTWTYDYVSRNIDTNNTFTGYVSLANTTTLHSYSIGDYIKIEQVDGGALYPLLEGIFVIVAIPNSQTIVINLLYNLISDTTPLPTVINGETTLIGDVTQYPDLLTSNGNCVFNGVFNITNFLAFNDNDYRTNITSTSKKFLTTRPNNFRMYKSQELYTMFNFYHSSANSIVSKVRYQNSNGDIIDSASISVSQGATLKPWLRIFKNGPGNHNGTSAVIGTLPLIKANTEWYEYWLVDSSNNQLTQKQRINLIEECEINTTELLFLDRLGSWSSFKFTLRQYENISNTKQTFNKSLDYNLGGAVQTPYLYGGDVTYNSTLNRTYTLNSSWLTEDDNRYMEELITSPMVLMRFSTGQEYIPVNILTNTFELNKERNTKLIRKEITVKTAWNEKINI